jgi:hypothetical protein
VCVVVLCAGLSVVGAPARAAKTDVVVLRNGDRVTCEVDQLERGRLVVKTDDMGTLEIEWDKVQSVTAAAEFDIDDLEGRRYVGSLAPAAPGELRITTTAGGANVLRLADVARIHRIGATFWKRLDGSLDVGTSYTSATALFKLDVAGSIGTHNPGYDISASGSTSITEQPDAESTSRSVLSFGYTRRFRRRWVGLFKTQLEQNRELGFDLRSSAALGGGRYLVQGRSDRLLGGLAFSINRERPVEGETTTNAELMAVVGYDRFAYDFPKLDVSVSAAGFVSLSEPGRRRLELEARLQREVIKDFYASLRGYESYDSRPPTAEASRNDWGVTFALGWSF